MNFDKWPTIKRLIARHEKRVEKFQAEETKLFHPHAVTLCRRIQKGIPEFTGCQLAMRMLFLEPRDLQIPIFSVDDPDEPCSDRLQNILDYLRYERTNYRIKLPDDTLNALAELDALSNFIDSNYSNVSELHVDLTKEKK